MFDILKFHTNNIFWFGCFHYNHNPVHWDTPLWKKRGFNSVNEHNQVLVERWNKKVKSDSIVFYLGDIVFGKDAEKTLQHLFNTLNFKELYLMPGNHYSGLKQFFYKNFDYGIDKYYRLTFRATDTKIAHIIPNYYEIYVKGVPIVMCHYPVKCHNGYAHESICLHSHVHGSFNDSLPTTLDKGKILDVGPESVGGPISFDEAKAIMDKKVIFKESHHSKEGLNPFS